MEVCSDSSSMFSTNKNCPSSITPPVHKSFTVTVSPPSKRGTCPSETNGWKLVEEDISSLFLTGGTLKLECHWRNYFFHCNVQDQMALTCTVVTNGSSRTTSRLMRSLNFCCITSWIGLNRNTIRLLWLDWSSCGTLPWTPGQAQQSSRSNRVFRRPPYITISEGANPTAFRDVIDLTSKVGKVKEDFRSHPSD